VLAPDNDKITSFGVFDVNGPPRYAFKTTTPSGAAPTSSALKALPPKASRFGLFDFGNRHHALVAGLGVIDLP